MNALKPTFDSGVEASPLPCCKVAYWQPRRPSNRTHVISDVTIRACPRTSSLKCSARGSLIGHLLPAPPLPTEHARKAGGFHSRTLKVLFDPLDVINQTLPLSMAPKSMPFLLHFASCLSLAYAALPPRLVRDGIGSIWGFGGVSYKAVNYIPVCGTLSLTDTDQYQYWTTIATCDASMSAYNHTTAASAVYDYTGTPSDVQIGTGTPVCLCFSLSGAPGKMDFCLDISSDGTPSGRFTAYWGDIVGGTFNSNADKALPQCKDANVPSISSSVYAELRASQSGSAPARKSSSMIITTTSGTFVQTFTAMVMVPTGSASRGNGSEGADSGGTSKGNQIALGVGLGMVCLQKLALRQSNKPVNRS